jgi:membrane-associated phospholipid phosphatase
MIVKPLIQAIKTNKFFFITYNLLLLIGLYPLLTWDKLTVFLFINKYHHPFFDKLFYYITYLGDGITYGLLLLILWLLKVPPRKLLVGAASFVDMSIIVQSLKRIIFSHYHRPIKFVEDPTQLHIVDGIDVLHHLSFPSGHAGTIFVAVCLVHLILPINNRLYSICLLCIAALVAYSRVYLCQHFYTDIYIGALIGGWTTFLVYSFFVERSMPNWLANRFSIKL